jgi:hypothetical protein
MGRRNARGNVWHRHWGIWISAIKFLYLPYLPFFFFQLKYPLVPFIYYIFMAFAIFVCVICVKMIGAVIRTWGFHILCWSPVATGIGVSILTHFFFLNWIAYPSMFPFDMHYYILTTSRVSRTLRTLPLFFFRQFFVARVKVF